MPLTAQPSSSLGLGCAVGISSQTLLAQRYPSAQSLVEVQLEAQSMPSQIVYGAQLLTTGVTQLPAPSQNASGETSPTVQEGAWQEIVVS